MAVGQSETPVDERTIAVLAPLNSVMKRGADEREVGSALKNIFTKEGVNDRLITGIGRQVNRRLMEGAIGFEEALLIGKEIGLWNPSSGDILATVCRKEGFWPEPQDAYFPLAAETALIELDETYGILNFERVFLSRLAQLRPDDPLQVETRLLIARSLTRTKVRVIKETALPVTIVKERYKRPQAELLSANKKYFEVVGLKVFKDEIAGWMEEEAKTIRREEFSQSEKSDEALRILRGVFEDARTNGAIAKEKEIKKILLAIAQDVYQRANRIIHEGGKDKSLSLVLNLLTVKGLAKILHYSGTTPVDNTLKKEILSSLINLKPADKQSLDSFIASCLARLIKACGLDEPDQREFLNIIGKN